VSRVLAPLSRYVQLRITLLSTFASGLFPSGVTASTHLLVFLYSYRARSFLSLALFSL
jgi:hypothetical protein